MTSIHCYARINGKLAKFQVPTNRPDDMIAAAIEAVAHDILKTEGTIHTVLALVPKRAIEQQEAA